MNFRNAIVFFLLAVLFGVMVYLGAGLFHTYTENADRDHLISVLYDLGLNASDYFKSSSKNGQAGDRNFLNWSLPERYSHVDFGSFSAISSRKKVNLTAVGNRTGRNGITNVRVNAVVDSAGTWVVVIN